MAIEKALFLALLVALVLLGQSVAHAQKGGKSAQAAATPSANLGLGAVPNMTGSVGLPAGATRSTSSAGLTPPGHENQSNDRSFDNKAADGKEKIAHRGGRSKGDDSDRDIRLDDLPTCR